MGNKKALLVGINYVNTPHALNGCVNDVNTMADILINHFDFPPKSVRMLTDESATTAGILERLQWLVKGAEAGDTLFFHYSGHGSQLIDTDYDSDKEPDGRDEIICPIDLNWRDKVIKDDDLKRIFARLPVGVSLTVVLDCCHSGSGLDQEDYFRPLGMGEARSIKNNPNKIRELPMPADIANRGRGLSLKPKPRKLVDRSVDEVGLLISGCQPHQTSADAWIHSRYMGAATYFLVYHLRHNGYKINYRDLVECMNKSLRNYGYSQRPELNGNETLWERNFLEPFTSEQTSSDDDSEGDPTTLDQLNQHLVVEFVDSGNQTADGTVGTDGTGSIGETEEEPLGVVTIPASSGNGESFSEPGKNEIAKWFGIGAIILAIAAAGGAVGSYLFFFS